MPQLQQLDTFTAQIFWLFVAFGIVYFYFAKFVVPKLGGLIQSREDTLANSINSAEDFKNAAIKTRSEYETKYQQSKSRALQIIMDASKKASQDYDSGLASAESELKKNIERSEKEIDITKNKALDELKAGISAFVDEVVEKLVGNNKSVVEKVKIKI